MCWRPGFGPPPLLRAQRQNSPAAQFLVLILCLKESQVLGEYLSAFIHVFFYPLAYILIMTTERSKRETVFPGSAQWSRTFRSESHDKPKSRTLGRSTLTHDRESKRLVPRINLPVNPLDSNRDHLIPIKEGSPWKYYKYAFGLELGGSVAVVCKSPASNKLFAIYNVSSPDGERMVYTLRQLKHDNLLRPEEILSFQDTFYIVTEYAAISLEEVIVVRPNEIQLAAIVYQVCIPYLGGAKC